MRPAFGTDIHRSAQPDIFFLKSFGSPVVPATEKVRQPLFQSALKAFVFGKIHVVRNAFVKIHDLRRSIDFSLWYALTERRSQTEVYATCSYVLLKSNCACVGLP